MLTAMKTNNQHFQN